MLNRDDRVGIYVTVIIHLAVLIVLLGAGIGRNISKENTFILDFTKQDELEKAQEQIARAEQIKAGLEEEIRQKLASTTPVRNIAVDRNGALKDDKGIDSRQLYEDNRRLQEELKNGYKPDENPSKDEVAVNEKEPEDPQGKKEQYSGASVLSYQLDGRKKLYLHTPAYKCMGAGTVTVTIWVGKDGKVKKAEIQGGSTDRCLQTNAIASAKRSRFTSSNDPKVPDPQIGSITYQFIAQQ